jgi:hypothetical protein
MSHQNYPRWTGPFVWDGNTLDGGDDWVVQLSDNDVEELRASVRLSGQSNKPIGQLAKADFAFRDLGQKLETIKTQLLDGRGFVLIRGLPANQWTDEELVRAYWGMGTWLGDAVSQNAKAHLLGHVIDQRADNKGDTRIYQTNRAQPFHSDSCDIVGLLCLRSAKRGGASSIASSAAIHNALLDSDREALKTLYGMFYCDRYGEIPEGKEPLYPVHIFNTINEQLVCCGMDPDIRSAQRLEGVPALSAAQLHALDCFQETARQCALKMSLQRGDIQLANNLIVVHAREAFEDHSDLDKRRYLVRLWLSSSQGRQLPEFLEERWGNIDVGSVRGGIKVAGAMKEQMEKGLPPMLNKMNETLKGLAEK